MSSTADSLLALAAASFRVPKPRAREMAGAALVLLVPPVVATAYFPLFRTAHRAVLYAAIPPFLALLAMLAPFLRPRVPVPARPANARPSHDGGRAPASDEDDDDEDDDDFASEYDDNEWE